MTGRCGGVRWQGRGVERCPGSAIYRTAGGPGVCDDHAMAQVRLYGLDALAPGDRSRFAALHYLLLALTRQMVRTQRWPAA